MLSLPRLIALSVLLAVLGVGVGVRWHALLGTEVSADVVGIELVRRENTDGGSREDLMPRVRFEREGVSREAVVSNEYIFGNVRPGDRLTVWVRGDDVIAQDTGNDLLRGALVGFACGVMTYLGGALLALVLKRSDAL